MALIDNPVHISPENVPDEQKETVQYLAEILNFFMEQTANTINGKLDYENLNRELKTIQVTVDANGEPTKGLQFSSDYRTLRGVKVLNATNLTNSTTYPTAAPFVIFTGNGQGIFTIKKILGLPANNNFQLLIELIP